MRRYLYFYSQIQLDTGQINTRDRGVVFYHHGFIPENRKAHEMAFRPSFFGNKSYTRPND